MTYHEECVIWRMMARLCARDLGDFREENGDVTFYLRCSDTFDYAVADAERVERTEVPVVFQLWQDHGYDGIVLWIWQKRGTPPVREILEQMPPVLRKEDV